MFEKSVEALKEDNPIRTVNAIHVSTETAKEWKLMQKSLNVWVLPGT